MTAKHTTPVASPTATPVPQAPERIGFGRRLLVMLYESLLLFGVLFGAGLPVVMIAGHPPDPGNPLYFAYLLLVGYVYFGWCWTRGGQTLAMRAWKVRVEREDGGRLRWRDAALRYLGGLSALACALLAARAVAVAQLPGSVEWLAALAGGAPGFIWALFDPRRRGWPDIFSATRLVRTTGVRR